MGADATVEGSIVGRLRLDITDWEAKLSEAEAKARELGRINPDVRVSAETAEAIAKLRAVEEAAAAAGGDHISHVTTVRSTVGNSGGEDITGSTVATAALAEAIRKLDAASLELDVAQAADEEQMRQTSVQALKESINMEALAAAERKASENAVQLSAAERLAADGANEQAAANGNNVSRMQLIIGAVAALVPMLGPLAGYATGVAGALAGMGAAGVLAILGIKNAMADGTVMGQTYAAGLQVLKGDLSQLEQTAASGILTGFQQAIDTIDNSMPDLNREIGLFSTQLGVTGNLVLNGVVTAFRILNPLFLAAGVYVEQLAAGFQSWTQNGGLQKFATMAMQDFPVVVNTLGSLAGAILNLIGAFEPLGVASLNLLTILVNVVSFLTTIMGPAFGPVVLGATAAFVAFKQWQAIGPIIEQVAWKLGALGVAADAAGGPVMWIVGGIGLLVAALTLGISATQQSTSAMEDYTAALQQDSGALGENMQKQVANNLQKDGALSAANQLGISTKNLTQATLDGGAAYDQLTSKLKATVQSGTQAIAAGDQLTIVHTKQAEAAQKVLDAIQKENAGVGATVNAQNQIADATGGANVQTNAQAAAQSSLAARYGMSLTAFQAAQAAQQKNASSAAATTQQLQLENDAAGLLTNAFTLLNGGSLSLMQAQTGAAAAGNTLLQSLKQNGTEMDGNSAKAVANQQALEAKAQADQQAAEAVAKSTNSTAQGTAAYAASKTALENELRAQGELTPAIQAYIDKLYAIPAVAKTKVEADTAAAAAAVAALQRQIDGLNANAIAVQARVNATGQAVASGHSAVARASGGSIPAYLAIGGSPFQPHGTDTIPAMLSPHEFVVKAPSAQAYPEFMQAYNDNPTRALQAVAASGASGPTQVTLVIENRTGTNWADFVDFRIEQKSSSKRVQLSAGRQQNAF